MVDRKRRRFKRTAVRPVAPPWTTESPQWQEVDRRLPANHLARSIAQAVEELDMAEVWKHYAGVGKRPLPPALLLKLMLYELQQGHASPADWHRDALHQDAARWLLRGLQPSRSALYEFRDRLASCWEALHEQVLKAARAQGCTSGERAALDGTLVAALASRHRLMNQAALDRRLQQLDEAVAAEDAGASPDAPPGWMARHRETRVAQRSAYRRAKQRLSQRQAENQQRRKSKRRPPEKMVVSVGDPDAAVGRDKLQTFRPLYNVQIVQDLDSAFVLAYDVFAQQNDNGTLPSMVRKARAWTGCRVRELLCDSTYANGLDAAWCRRHDVRMYAPVQENDFTAKRKRDAAPTQIPKSAFTWLPHEETFQCPEGHRLKRGRTSLLPRLGNQHVEQTLFHCPAEHCRTCPRRQQCTPKPERGRSVSRLQYEDLLEELRARMQTDEGRTLYKLRRQTVELRNADLKQHRGFDRLHSRGLVRAKAEVGATLLAHNLLALHRSAPPAAAPSEPLPQPP